MAQKAVMPLALTDKAALAIRSRMESAPRPCIGLRLTIKPTGCSGHSYVMGYVEEGEDLEGDDRIESGGAVLYVAKAQSWMIFGATVDYGADELGNEKFLFDNPNETGRCGCGESFQVGA